MIARNQNPIDFESATWLVVVVAAVIFFPTSLRRDFEYGSDKENHTIFVCRVNIYTTNGMLFVTRYNAFVLYIFYDIHWTQFTGQNSIAAKFFCEIGE